MNWTSISTVAFVCLLIIVLVVSFASLFLPALYQYNKSGFWIVAPLCCLTVFLGCYSYFRAVLNSPGYTDPSLKSHYSPQQLDRMQSRHLQQRQYKKLIKEKKLTPEIRKKQISNLIQNSYCQKCDNVKPSRTHHCKICNRCIERMDHHCPWVGNCVGKHNHKYFLLFLLYITIALMIVSVCILADYINLEQPVLSIVNEADELYYMIVLVTGGMCSILMFSIGFLLISQILLIVNNLTTLESFYDGIYQNNPFDQYSIGQHFKEIIGDSWWFLPTKPFPWHEDQVNVAFLTEA